MWAGFCTGARKWRTNEEANATEGETEANHQKEQGHLQEEATEGEAMSDAKPCPRPTCTTGVLEETKTTEGYPFRMCKQCGYTEPMVIKDGPIAVSGR